MAKKGIDYDINISLNGKEALSQVLTKLSQLEKKIGNDNTKAAVKLKKELAAIRKNIIQLDLSKLDSQDRLRYISERLNGIDKGTNKAAKNAKDVKISFSGLGMVTQALKGDIDGVISGIQNAFEKTRAWGKITEKLGFEKAAGAIGFAVMGIKSGIDALNQLVAVNKKFNAMNRDSDLSLYSASATHARESLSDREARRIRAQRNASIGFGISSAKRANALAGANTALDWEYQSRVIATQSEREREDIRREIDWKKRQAAMAYELAEAEQEIAKAELTLQQAREHNSDLAVRLNGLNEVYGKAYDALNQSEGSAAEAAESFVANLYETLGGNYLSNLIGANGPEAIRERLEKAKNVVDEIASIKKEIEDKIKDSGIDMREASASVENAKLARRNILMAQDSEKMQRQGSEIEVSRLRAIETEENEHQLAEDIRKRNEAEVAAREDELNDMADYAEKKRLLQEKIYRTDSWLAEQEKKLQDASKGRDYSTRNSWDANDRRDAERAYARVEELKDALLQLQRDEYSLRRQGANGEVVNARTLAMENRDREEADRDALNNWASRVAGPMAGLGIAQATMKLRNEQLEKSRKAAKDLANEIRARMENEGVIGKGQNINLNDYAIQQKMTEEERTRYTNAKADVIRDTNNVRSARYDLMGMDFDRNQRMAEFRINAMQQGNRLTAMGLGGDIGAAGFAKSTAGNTKELVALTKSMLKHFEGGGGSVRRIGGGLNWGM